MAWPQCECDIAGTALTSGTAARRMGCAGTWLECGSVQLSSQTDAKDETQSTSSATLTANDRLIAIITIILPVRFYRKSQDADHLACDDDTTGESLPA